MSDKKMPFCWKCNSAMKTLTKGGSFVLDGCTECSDIKNFDDAQKLCPLFDHEVKVVIAVIDGECSIVEKPDHVLVEVRDYVEVDDNETDGYHKDDKGDYYRVFSFPATKIKFSANGASCFRDVEIEQEKPLKPALKNITILQHNVSYYLDENELLTIEVGDCEYEHILYMITEGYIEGELSKTDPKDDGETIRGWWKIVNPAN